MEHRTSKQEVIRLLALFLGVIVSWTTTIRSFITFYNYEGTIFKIKDCVIPNPVTTPCFWGAIAFFAALVWAWRKYLRQKTSDEKYFLYFMIGSFIFAWSNFAIELKGVTPKPGAILAPCPAGRTSPFLSPCFFGSVLFTVSLFMTYRIIRYRNKEEK